jgi:hypothetical protein
MRIQRFSLPRDQDAWEALTSQEGVTVDHQYLISEDGKTAAYVQFSFVEDRTITEKETMEFIKKVSLTVKDDKVLPTLKNATQRELYFLEVYGIDSKTSGQVWEYLKMVEKVKEGVA